MAEIVAPLPGKALSTSWVFWVNLVFVLTEIANYALNGPLGEIIPADARVAIVAVVTWILRFKTSLPITGILKPTV
jgi:hypothetical protein